MLRLRRSRGGLRRFWWILLLALGAKAAAICHPTGGFEIQKEKTGACRGSAVRYAPPVAPANRALLWRQVRWVDGSFWS